MRVIVIFRYDQLWFQGLTLTILGSMIFTFKNLDSRSNSRQLGMALEMYNRKFLCRRPCSIPRECVLFFSGNQFSFYF